MKKLLAFLIVVGAAGFLVWKFVLAPAPQRSCARLAALCGQKTAALEGCVRGMTELGNSNREAASKFDSCVGKAGSCLEGTGCLVGAGVSAAGGALNDFVKGIGNAIGK
jgi:hypothetical protein